MGLQHYTGTAVGLQSNLFQGLLIYRVSLAAGGALSDRG